MNQQKYLRLLLQLKHFGLNPREWTVAALDEIIFELRHKEDPEFVLHGHTDPFNSEWLHLEWVL